MSMQEQLKEAYVVAMKARDALRTQTLRLVMADVKQFEVDKRKEPTDDDVLDILQKNAKMRNEAIEAAKPSGRQDIVDQETAELEIIMSFLPELMSEEELVAIVEATIAETGAESKKDTGQVMGALMPKVKGRADGRLVAQLVGERLA